MDIRNPKLARVNSDTNSYGKSLIVRLSWQPRCCHLNYLDQGIALWHFGNTEKQLQRNEFLGGEPRSILLPIQAFNVVIIIMNFNLAFWKESRDIYKE
jgi:hypothetical protein